MVQDAVNGDSGARGAAFKQSISKQSIRESANFLVNIPMVCKASYARPDVPGVVANEGFYRLSLFTGPQRAGLTRGGTALFRLLKPNAALHSCGADVCDDCITAAEVQH